MIQDKLLDLSLWLDGDWARYWGMSWGLFALLLLSAVFPFRREKTWAKWNHPALFAGLLLLTLLAFRWPSLALPREATPDESQFLAGALTMGRTHAFWSVDTMSSGPLSILPLTLPDLLGLSVNFTTGRVMALLLAWGSIVCTWLALRHLFGEWLGRMLVLPMACVLALVTYYEFTQYASEPPPVFYLSLALWLGVTTFDQGGLVVNRRRLVSAGVMLGLLPFSKLQAIPLGAVLGLGTLILTLRQPLAPWRHRVRDAGLLVAGTGGAFLLVIALILTSGSWHHFRESYLSYNIIYAQARVYPWSGFAKLVWFMAGIVWGFRSYLLYSWIMVGLGLVFSWQAGPSIRRHLGWSVALFTAGYFAVGAPGREFQHYLLLLILPTSWLLALLFGALIQRTPVSAWQRGAWLALFIGLGVVPQIHFFRTHPGNLDHGQLQAARAQAISPASQVVLKLHQRGDTLAVWGWRPAYHVETQLPQAAHEAHTERQILPNALRDYFRDRYLADLQRTRPAFFLDAVGPGQFGFIDRPTDGHETFAELGRFIASDYIQVADVDSTRIYVRRDRAPVGLR